MSRPSCLTPVIYYVEWPDYGITYGGIHKDVWWIDYKDGITMQIERPKKEVLRE